MTGARLPPPLLLSALALALAAAVRADRCPAEELNLAGTFLCYKSSAIVRFEGTARPPRADVPVAQSAAPHRHGGGATRADSTASRPNATDGSVSNANKTDESNPISSGPDASTWWWLRNFPAPARDPYSFEGEAGIFKNDTGSVSSTEKLYPVDGSFDDDYHCVLEYSINKDWWEASCMGSSGYTSLELGDGGCDVDQLAVTMVTYPSAPGVPHFINSGLCVRADDDFLGDGVDRVAEDGDLNGLGEEDEDCAAGFSLVHQIGQNDAENTLTDYVIQDNCVQVRRAAACGRQSTARRRRRSRTPRSPRLPPDSRPGRQVCAPNFILGMIAADGVVPGSCLDEGFGHFVTETSIALGPMNVFVDVYEKGED